MELLTYFPVWFKFVLTLSAFLFFIIGYYYRFHDHTYRHKWEKLNEPSPQERRVKFNKEELGFSDVISELPIMVSEADNHEAVSAPQELLKVQVGKVIEHTSGAESQDVKLTGPDGETSDFTYLLLHDEFSWKKSSIDTLENHGGSTGLHLEEALAEEFVEDVVSNSALVFCIGLASSEPMKYPNVITNTQLSDLRAINMCVALARLGFIDFKPPSGAAVALGLGQRLPAESSQKLYRRERAAIILAIKEPRKMPPKQQLIDVVYSIMDYRDVALGTYERDDNLAYNSIMVEDLEYCDHTNLKLNTMPDQDEILRAVCPKD